MRQAAAKDEKLGAMLREAKAAQTRLQAELRKAKAAQECLREQLITRTIPPLNVLSVASPHLDLTAHAKLFSQEGACCSIS